MKFNKNISLVHRTILIRQCYCAREIRHRSRFVAVVLLL